jgi:hypothetical protein
MAFGKKADEQAFDQLLLTDQNLADFVTNAIDQRVLVFDAICEIIHDAVFSYSKPMRLTRPGNPGRLDTHQGAKIKGTTSLVKASVRLSLSEKRPLACSPWPIGHLKKPSFQLDSLLFNLSVMKIFEINRKEASHEEQLQV